MSKITGFSPMGTYFGYPQCCQRYFYKRGYCDTNFPLLGTGYIPCLSCRKKTEEELIKTINENRYCKELFPDGDCVSNGKYTKPI